MTDKEKVESTLYPQYDGMKKLSEIDAGNDVNITVGPGGPFATKEPMDRERSLVCAADVIVRGEILGRSSHPTAGGTFLFSSLEIAVKDVIKDSRRAPLRSGELIIASRPGGLLCLGGRTVRALDENYPQLEVGKSYICFLKFIPGTGDYGTPAFDGTVETPGTKATARLVARLRRVAKTCSEELDHEN